ncbi:MAG TPA: hypothetical protein VJB57_21635 [Dehalococcoidia bacterium]|nr:hypothetical protein [Dehalococcoidia bacterium]
MSEYVPAPAITLTAVGSGREIVLDRPGTALVVICLAQETQKDAEAIELAVRARWPSASDVLVVHVIDLRKVPGIFRSMAENLLASEHKKAVAELPEDQAPAPDDYVVILPDWEGAVANALGLQEPAKVVGAAVISAGGLVVGLVSGPDGDAVVALVEKAM